MGAVLRLPVARLGRVLVVGSNLPAAETDFDCEVAADLEHAVRLLANPENRVSVVVFHRSPNSVAECTAQLEEVLLASPNTALLFVGDQEPEVHNLQPFFLPADADHTTIVQLLRLACERDMALDGLGAATRSQQRSVATLLNQVALRQEAERQSYRHANYDLCTGLPNRRLFEQRLYRAVHRDRGLAAVVGVVALGIDNLPFLISALGHDTADEMLARIAERLRHALEPGSLAGRLPYGEFWLLLTELDDEGEAEACTRTIMRTIEEPMTLSSGRRVDIRCRAGLALATDDEATPQTLMRCAMAALNRTNKRGSYFEIDDKTLMTSAEEKLVMEAELRAGLEQQEFVLHYQPLVDLSHGDIDGFEALIRWQHPKRGQIPPLKFIPVAEESGLIIPIGRWVLQQALREQLKMQAYRDRPVTMSVNVSAAQLHGSDLCDDVRQALAVTGADPTMLKLELTESELMRNPESAARTLAELRQLEIQVFIDDFGTGYSSLSYLQRLPVDALKIDRSFVVEMLSSPDAQAIVRTIVALARSLNLKVVAEGVERTEELQVLKALGCDFGQGYFFSRPTSFDAVVDLLQQDPRW